MCASQKGPGRVVVGRHDVIRSTNCARSNILKVQSVIKRIELNNNENFR